MLNVSVLLREAESLNVVHTISFSPATPKETRFQSQHLQQAESSSWAGIAAVAVGAAVLLGHVIFQNRND